MTNKFTKSVLEQQAKAQRVRPAVVIPAAAPPDRPEPADPSETLTESEQLQNEEFEAYFGDDGDIFSIAKKIQALYPNEDEEDDAEIPQKPARRAKTTPASKSTPDLTDFIVRDTGRTAKNKTFYLDAAVIDAIHRCALAQKVTDSKLVNDILRKILAV